MGAKNKNFYHDYATRLGYGDVATRIQDLYLSGKKEEAQALVPDALIDEVSLVGSHGRIIERLAPWKEAGKRGEVGSMLLSVANPQISRAVCKGNAVSQCLVTCSGCALCAAVSAILCSWIASNRGSL